jgi:hypothetical protein
VLASSSSVSAAVPSSNNEAASSHPSSSGPPFWMPPDDLGYPDAVFYPAQQMTHPAVQHRVVSRYNSLDRR